MTFEETGSGTGCDSSATATATFAGKILGEPVIVVRHLSKTYKTSACYNSNYDGSSVKALNDVHLAPGNEIYPILSGEFVILRGPSGGGKTSLLNILGTVDSASSGQIEILGHIIDSDATDSFLSDLRLENLGFVFQTFNLLSNLSALENVELPMAILGKLSASERRLRAIELLRLVGLQDRTDHLPSEMSGGEQQRVAIARALANQPEILLLDEPTGDLDTYNTVQIMDLLLDINNTHCTTFVMVTHNPDIECYANRLLYLKDGQIQRQAINKIQCRLDYEEYVSFLKQRDLESDK